MKKSYIIYLLLIVSLVQTSCRSSKDLIMFREHKEELELSQISVKAPEYKVKPYDNLYVSILTLDEEVNSLFNPSLGGTGFGSGTQQMYGDRSSQYINGYMVARDGTISLPIIGKVELAGLNLEEAQNMIIQAAKEYLKDPNAKVKVLNFRVNVLGEVRNPGLYYNYEGKMNVMEAIGMANGITDFADIRNVMVIRQQSGSPETYNLNFKDMGVYESEVFYLEPNDIVYIQPNQYKRTRENTNIYSLILSTISTLLVAGSVVNNIF